MTFLEICQAVRQEAGISGTGPVSVSGQTGINKKIVDWVARAYAEIQTEHEDWRFLWVPVTFQTQPGKRDYHPITDLELTEFNQFDLDSFFAFRSGAQRWPLRFMPFEDFREFHRYDRDGEPVQFTILPNYTIRLDTTPSTSETIEFAYYRVPFVMTGNLSAPAFKAQHHSIILYKALMYYAADEEAPAIYQDARANYEQRMLELEKSEYRLQAINMAPLA